MSNYSFRAQAICSEFNIVNIAKHYKITKKVKWEEPLIIRGELLNNIKDFEDKSVYLYYFGTMVFINFNSDEIESYIDYIKSIPNSIKSINTDMKYECIEEYKIIEDTNSDEQIDFDDYITKEAQKYHFDMIALVLAKSVALEVIEARVDIVFDDIELIIRKMKLGKLNINEKKSVSLIGKILAFKHTTISYIMLLDKPAVTWKDQDAGIFFNDLADLFELDDRHEKLNAKIETLLNTTEIFADLSHSKKSTNLEIIVILLILVEVIHAFEEPIITLLMQLVNLL
jgi:uncharacterized Rmd1/YagE family protein